MNKRQKYLLITILIIAFPLALLAPEGRYVFLLVPLYIVTYILFKMFDWFKENGKTSTDSFLIPESLIAFNDAR